VIRRLIRNSRPLLIREHARLFLIPTLALSILQSHGDEDSSQSLGQDAEDKSSFKDKLDCLKYSKYFCFCHLQKQWEETYPQSPLDDEMIEYSCLCQLKKRWEETYPQSPLDLSLLDALSCSWFENHQRSTNFLHETGQVFLKGDSNTRSS
jgi:hypothetical protein